jgi:hypothetical protein
MEAVLNQLRILAGGLICGAAFIVIVLVVAGQL